MTSPLYAVVAIRFWADHSISVVSTVPVANLDRLVDRGGIEGGTYMTVTTGLSLTEAGRLETHLRETGK